MWHGRFKAALARALKEAKIRNPRYSSRSMARAVGLSSGAFSEYASGKRHPSLPKAIKIIEQLPMNDAERLTLLDLLRAGGAARVEISASHHHIFEHWEYFAVRNFLLLPGGPQKAATIAERLGLEIGLVQQSLDEMLRLRLVKKTAKGFLHAGESLTSTDQVSAFSLKAGHAGALENSLTKLSLPVEERDFSSLVFVGNRKMLSDVKREIRDFYAKIEDLMQQDPNDELFRLSIQICPLTIKKEI